MHCTYIQQLDDFVLAMDLRFGFSILILCVPILSFFGIIGTVAYAVKMGGRGKSGSSSEEGAAYDGI